MQFILNAVDKKTTSKIYNNRLLVLEEKLKPVKEILPPFGIIDYITDIPGKRLSLTDDTLREYFMFQYIMSPSILSRVKQNQYVIGNYRKKGDFPKIADENYKLVKNFKNGIALFYKS